MIQGIEERLNPEEVEPPKGRRSYLRVLTMTQLTVSTCLRDLLMRLGAKDVLGVIGQALD